MFNRGLKEKVSNLEYLVSRSERELKAEREIRKFLTKGDFSLNVFFEKFAHFQVKEIQEVFEIVLQENNVRFTTVDFGVLKHYTIRVPKSNKFITVVPIQLIKHIKQELLYEHGDVEHVFKAEATQEDA